MAWYATNRRDLPWRRTPTPYRTLVSEVMLQQTRVETALPYFRKFVRAFPGFAALARASEEEVLVAWEGLGYYRRARDLLRLARHVRQRGGRLPKSAVELSRLPGIGPYTAAAVASIAFGAQAPALDGNGERVLARLLARGRPPSTERPLLRAILGRLIPARRPGDFNQALMELGATICTPRRPDCPRCPVRVFCQARRKGDPDSYPLRSPHTTVPIRREDVLIVRRKGRVLLRLRPKNGLLGGMWALPSYPRKPALSVSATTRPGSVAGGAGSLTALGRETGLVARPDTALSEIRHAYTHFTLVLRPLVCSLGPDIPSQPPLPGGWRWATGREIASLPMGKADRRALAALAGLSDPHRSGRPPAPAAQPAPRRARRSRRRNAPGLRSPEARPAQSRG